ncbi:MAG: autotransporter outer membrane beta-barrel domain-containing protein [Megasphaera sp.]|nr:autotransporter outer membrane beta-barrel domain-containing protein [Megasphaera sp.]
MDKSNYVSRAVAVSLLGAIFWVPAGGMASAAITSPAVVDTSTTTSTDGVNITGGTLVDGVNSKTALAVTGGKTLTVTGTTDITETADNSAYKLHGVTVDTDTTLTMNGDATIHTTFNGLNKDQKVSGIENIAGGTVNMNGNTTITSTDTLAGEVYGIWNQNGSTFVGKDLDVTANTSTSNAWGISNGVEGQSGTKFTADAIKITMNNAMAGTQQDVGIWNAGADTVLTANKGVDITYHSTSGDKNFVGVFDTSGTGKVSLNGGLKVTASTTGASNMIGIDANKSTTINGDVTMDFSGATAHDKLVASTVGMYFHAENVTYTVNGDFAVNIHDTTGSRLTAVGSQHGVNGHNVVLNGAKNTINIDGNAPHMEGIFSAATFADNSTTDITVKETGTDYQMIHGIYDMNDGTGVTLGENATLNVVVDDQGATVGYNDSTAQGAVGIYGGNGITLEEGSVTNITVKGGVDNTNPVKDQIYGLGGATGMMGKIEAVGDININMPTAGGTGIKSFDYNGKSSHITGNLVVNTNAGTALATYRSPLTVDAPADKVVQLTGDVTNIRNTQNSILTVNFKNAESFLTGASLHATANTAKTTLNFSGGSLWNLTADSVATNLTNTDSIINMHYTGDDTYETIHTYTYSGDNGILVMDTDLASETNGDKLYIKSAGTGGGFIQVADKSMNSGIMVNAKGDETKTKLLVVGGAGANGTTWTGKSLDTGGLWELTPTVEKLEDNQWYLTMMKRSVNPGTKTIMGSLDSAYGLWRYDDTLRKRLGDLRYIDNDQNGLWVRLKAGKLAADSYDGNYQMYQIGYDKKSNNTIYGIAVDHSKASNDYYAGDGDNSMTNLTLYATNYRGGVDVKNQKSGSTYSDLVLRAGRLQSNVDSYGTYHDSLGYDTWGYNISYEMGKTFRNDKGWFIEPEAQLSYGRLRGGDYTTQRGTHVHKDDIDSLLGRIGFVAGRKINDDKDFYFKANVYREFAGDGDMRFVHGDQTMLDDVANRDTWFEMGVGGNIRLADVMTLGLIQYWERCA